MNFNQGDCHARYNFALHHSSTSFIRLALMAVQQGVGILPQRNSRDSAYRADHCVAFRNFLIDTGPFIGTRAPHLRCRVAEGGSLGRVRENTRSSCREYLWLGI